MEWERRVSSHTSFNRKKTLTRVTHALLDFPCTLTLGTWLEDISSGCHQGMLLSESQKQKQRQVPACVELPGSAYYSTRGVHSQRDVNVVGRGTGRNIWSSSRCHSWHFFFFFPRALCVAFLITFIFWIIFDIAKRGYQHLISFGGLLMYVFLLFIFSKHPNRVSISSILALCFCCCCYCFYSVSQNLFLYSSTKFSKSNRKPINIKI